MRTRIIISLLFLLPFLGMAQEKVKEPTRGLALGIFAQTYGFGMEVQYHVYRGDLDFVTGVSLSSVRHPRQLKIESAYSDQGGKRYFYDKKNYGFVLTPTFGISKLLIGKDDYSQVSLRATLSGGPALGILKPYYLEVAVPFSGNQAYVEIDKYDATKYNYTNIVGQADYLVGIGELSVVPGIHGKFSTMLNFAARSNLIRAVEMNVNATYFVKPLDLMDLTKDKSLFVGGGISLLFGDMW